MGRCSAAMTRRAGQDGATEWVKEQKDGDNQQHITSRTVRRVRAHPAAGSLPPSHPFHTVQCMVVQLKVGSSAPEQNGIALPRLDLDADVVVASTPVGDCTVAICGVVIGQHVFSAGDQDMNTDQPSSCPILAKTNIVPPSLVSTTLPPHPFISTHSLCPLA